MASKLNTLRDGFIEELKDLYSAENQLLKTLPKMGKKATSETLKSAFNEHLAETQMQAERLNEISTLLDERLSGKICKAMQGLIEEGSAVLEEKSDNTALVDLMLVGSAVRVEHYEMAAYGTAHGMAVELGEDKIAKLLKKTLEEEIRAEKKLCSISEDELLSEANTDSEDAEPNRTVATSSKVQKKNGNVGRALRFVAFLALIPQLATVSVAETHATKVKNEVESTSYRGDNTGLNVRDRDAARVTADDQKMGGEELEVLGRIRRSIVANENLSTNAHNVKIIVESGKVTLRGPVKSEKERSWIADATTQAAKGYRVVNQLEIESN